jgi:hypothetical protein
MSVASRLRRLEGDGGGCAICGGVPQRFDVRTGEPSSPFYRTTPAPEPVRCQGCGRPLTFTINIQYGDPFDVDDLEDE